MDICYTEASLIGRVGGFSQDQTNHGRLVRNLLIFAALAVLAFVVSTPIDILAYFYIYLLVEFVVFIIRRVQRRLERRKLSIAGKDKVALPKGK